MFLLLNELDTPTGVEEGNTEQTKPSKFLLWQDVLLGLFDKHVEGLDLQSYYEQLEGKFRKYRDNSQSSIDYIFAVPEKLSRVLALKANIGDRKSTRLNSSHVAISYAVFCLKKKN